MDYEAIVIGAGPSGLSLAAELARYGVDVAILERRIGRDGAGTRAVGVHGRTLAALEPSGAAERILADAARITRGIARSGGGSGRRLGEVRIDRLRMRFPFVATAPQSVTEAAVGYGAPEPMRGAEVLSVSQAPDGVRLAVRIGSVEVELRARVAVVAAGGSGRGLLSPFAEARVHEYPDRYVMTDLFAGGGPSGEYAGGQAEDTAIITLDPSGVVESFPLPGGRRLVAWQGGDWDPAAGLVSSSGENAEILRRAVAERAGEPRLAEGIGSAASFRIRRVLLSRMRWGRVFVIGDAAHEISPIGGQGMNLGIIDAATLAPALARRLREGGPIAGAGGGSGSGPASAAGTGSGRGEAELDRWERDRLASARTAGRVAGLSTSLGRGRSPALHAAALALVGGALAGPLGGFAARAYTMGFDRSRKSIR